jgi:hypothetical protein
MHPRGTMVAAARHMSEIGIVRVALTRALRTCIGHTTKISWHPKANGAKVQHGYTQTMYTHPGGSLDTGTMYMAILAAGVAYGAGKGNRQSIHPLDSTRRGRIG